MVNNTTVRLSKREQEILALVLDDVSSAKIAEMLSISLRTVDTHRKNIIRKTKSKTMVSLVKWAIRNGYMEGYYYRE